MGVGALLEPLVVVSLLFGGTWINRNREYRLFGHSDASSQLSRSSSPASSIESGRFSPTSESSLLAQLNHESRWRSRELRILGMTKRISSPNTRRFQDHFLSRLLKKFPFLVEAWYWALIYWVYQLGRALTAITMVSSTVTIARDHALQIIHLEQRLHIFIEPSIQNWFIKHPLLMHWTNRIYSFIHIPGTILFLIWLFHYTTTQNLSSLPLHNKPNEQQHSPLGPVLYAARRRTMATCNLLAFIVFTLWPCMPPRLLSDPDVPGAIGREARSYGFVDTVHGAEGESSVWTTNKFCNQYAAMPSLHFGYSLLIGLTIMSIPLAQKHHRARTIRIGTSLRIKVLSARRIVCLALGVAYPSIILAAIIATANHFVLDAVAGALVCVVAWGGNGVLLNLLPVEDWLLWVARIHKPESRAAIWEDGEERRGGKGDVVD